MFPDKGGSPCSIWDADSIESKHGHGFKAISSGEEPPRPAAASIRAAQFRSRRSSSPNVMPMNLTSLLKAADETSLLTEPAGEILWAMDTRCPQLVASAESILERLSIADKTRVSRYRIVADRNHSLVSVLLQRYLIRTTFGVDDSQYAILRTTENKPYLCLGQCGRDKGSWNYNVSHQGSFACIASHRTCLIGIDIVEVKLRPSWTKGVSAYIQMFQGGQFSKAEVRCMLLAADPLVHFFINWSMKEAFIKAVGTGLYYDLASVEFLISYDEEAKFDGGMVRGSSKVTLKDIHQPQWKLEFCSLDATHIVSIATGPVQEAAHSFKSVVQTTADLKCLPPTESDFDHDVSHGKQSLKFGPALKFISIAEILLVLNRQ